MKAVPLELKQANEFVDKLHRHHDSVHRDKFRLGCEVDGKLVGVVQLALLPTLRIIPQTAILHIYYI